MGTCSATNCLTPAYELQAWACLQHCAAANADPFLSVVKLVLLWGGYCNRHAGATKQAKCGEHGTTEQPKVAYLQQQSVLVQFPPHSNTSFRAEKHRQETELVSLQ